MATSSRSAGDVSVRFSVQDAEVVRQALDALGKDGQAALNKIDAASRTPSAGLKAVSAVMSDIRGQAMGMAGGLGIAGDALLALGTSGLVAGAAVGGIYLLFSTVKDGAKEFGNFSRSIRDNSEALGLSSTQYQSFLLILQRHSVEEEKAASILQKLSKAREEAAHAQGALYDALKQQSPELARQFALSTSLSQAIDILSKALSNATEKQKIFLLSAAAGKGSALALGGFQDLFDKGGIASASDELVKLGLIFQQDVIDRQAAYATAAQQKSQFVERAWNEAYAAIYSKWKEFKHQIGFGDSQEIALAVKVKLAAEGDSKALLQILGSFVTGTSLGSEKSVPINLLPAASLIPTAVQVAEFWSKTNQAVIDSITGLVRIPGDAIAGKYSKTGGYPEGSEEAEFVKSVSALHESADALRLAAYGLSARGEIIPNLIPESMPGVISRSISGGLGGAAAVAAGAAKASPSDTFADRFGFPATATSADIPLPKEQPSASQKALLQVNVPEEQKRLAILGDVATITEKVKAKEDQLTLERMNGANVSDSEAKRILANYKNQLDAAQIAARGQLGLGTEQEIEANKLIQLQEQRAKGVIKSDEEMATAERVVRKEAVDTANAIAVKASQTPALTKLSQDSDNLAKSLDDGLASSLRGIGQEFSLLNTSTDTFGTKLKNVSLKIADAAYQAILMKVAIKPLADLVSGGLGSLFGASTGGGGVGFNGTGGGGASLPNALGNIFDRGGLHRFAMGGVVSRPTFFPFARGIGLMGEAGPEAIMPLTRLPNGMLGVRHDGGGRGGDIHVHNHVSVDAKGADPAAVVRLGQVVDDLSKTLEKRAVSAVQKAQRDQW